MDQTAAVSIREQSRDAASSLFRRNLRKFFNNKLAVVGLVVAVLIAAACLTGAILQVDYSTPSITEMKRPPSAAHPLGTDTIGRDLLARILIGGCWSILIGVLCAAASSVLGAFLGAVSGYAGGFTDKLLIRVSELFQAFPQLVLVMIVVAVINQRGLLNLLFIFILTGWMTTYRMVRGEFLSLKGETYVRAAQAFGMGRLRIMFGQILPNVVSPIIVAATTNVAFFILQEAALSFIGLGVSDSTPTWGNILNAAKSVSVVTNQWWIWVFPGLAVTLFVLAINFLGDGLRDVLDAKQQ